jgi:RNA polymerase sigma-70 factor, ECF subfamily
VSVERLRDVRLPVTIRVAMDEQAAAAWRRQYGSVYRFVRRRSGSREDAEDLTQEVFAAAVAQLGRAREQAEAPPLAWLYTVARRRLIDRLRAARSLVPLPEEYAGSERAYGPAIVRGLVDGLASLDEQQRRIVVAKLFEGRSFAEIAPELGVSEQACRMRLSRALAQLRRHLVEKGVVP